MPHGATFWGLQRSYGCRTMKGSRLMSVIVQIKNECGHKLPKDRALCALFAMAQVLDVTT
jgi:hypothetical protein